MINGPAKISKAVDNDTIAALLIRTYDHPPLPIARTPKRAKLIRTSRAESPVRYVSQHQKKEREDDEKVSHLIQTQAQRRRQHRDSRMHIHVVHELCKLNKNHDEAKLPVRGYQLHVLVNYVFDLEEVRDRFDHAAVTKIVQAQECVQQQEILVTHWFHAAKSDVEGENIRK